MRLEDTVNMLAKQSMGRRQKDSAMTKFQIFAGVIIAAFNDFKELKAVMSCLHYNVLVHCLHYNVII